MSDKWLDRADKIVTAWAGCMAVLLMIMLTVVVVGLFVSMFTGSL
jgi:low affinity Fe/Cu permease